MREVIKFWARLFEHHHGDSPVPNWPRAAAMLRRPYNDLGPKRVKVLLALLFSAPEFRDVDHSLESFMRHLNRLQAISGPSIGAAVTLVTNNGRPGPLRSEILAANNRAAIEEAGRRLREAMPAEEPS